ncbi:hypothetical protein B0O99DRAFT_649184 [Bisporella sp. PMI_857]|nr:hypothetical protein B0O99DRAFT_649184 [Bisporella sp. PMI_857]
MLEFMDYVQHAFYNASNWNYENSYSQLTATARALLDFETPRGLRLNVSSLSSPNFATSYNLGSVGLVDGSFSYLYSSCPLRTISQSSKIDLHDVIRGYRQIQELRKPDEPWEWEQWHAGRRIDSRDTLLYGRLYLPLSTLEALYLRRLSPTPAAEVICPTRTEDRIYGRFSAGAEMYYGALNKSGGVSFGGRFATLPAHRGLPLTATLTLNPLMGNISTTYAVKAGRDLSLCSKFDFNVYSYESDVMIGCELWRMKQKVEKKRERSMAAKLAWKLDDIVEPAVPEPEEVAGVLKARIDQNWRLGLLWEGRIKELMFTLGSSIDMKRRDQPFRALGLELQYSS